VVWIMKWMQGSLIQLVISVLLLAACGNELPAATHVSDSAQGNEAGHVEPSVGVETNVGYRNPIAAGAKSEEAQPVIETVPKPTPVEPEHQEPSPSAADDQLRPIPETGQKTTSVESKHPEPVLPSTDNRLPAIYQQFVESKIGLMDQEAVVDFIVEDIDQDGYVEAVVAVGYDKTYFSKIYLLQNREGMVSEVSSNQLHTGGYGANEIDLVQLEDRPHKVIYTGLTNDANMIGLRLDEYKNGKVTPLAYSASATGSGGDVLLDENQDGRIDGYVQNRGSYDVLYYGLSRIYKLSGGQFELERVDIEFREYPNNPKDVVFEYLSLFVLNKGKSPDMDKRMQELCPNCVADIKSNDQLARSLYEILAYDKSALNIEIQEEALSARVKVAIKQDSPQNAKWEFELVKTESKWTIKSVRPEKVNEEKVSG
jgi:hypothetical protein